MLTFGVEALKVRVNNSHSNENMRPAVEFRNRVRNYKFTEKEKNLISSHNLKTSVNLYYRAVTRDQTFTCSIYVREKKRSNFNVCFLNSSNDKVFGEIKLFLESSEGL